MVPAATRQFLEKQLLIRSDAANRTVCAAIAVILVAVTLRTTPASAQGVDGSSPNVALLTEGPGGPFFSWMGHSALVVTDQSTGAARVFDYGVVPDGPATVRGLIDGDLTAYMGEHELTAEYRSAVQQGRSIRLQQLALAPAARLELLRLLREDQRQSAGYRYDNRTDNCATRIRDLLDRVTQGALRRAGSVSAATTLRTLGFRYTAVSMPVSLLMDVAMNDEVDGPATRWDAAAFPAELALLVASSTISGPSGPSRALAIDGTSIASPRPDPPRPLPERRGLLLLIGMAAAATAILLGAAARGGARIPRIILGASIAIVGGVLGILGTVLAAAWLFTDYSFARHNANLLLINPLLLGAVPFGVRYAAGSVRAASMLQRSSRILLVIALLTLAGKALHFVDQDNSLVILLVLPLLGGLTAALQLQAKRPLRQSLPSATARQPLLPRRVTVMKKQNAVQIGAWFRRTRQLALAATIAVVGSASSCPDHVTTTTAGLTVEVVGTPTVGSRGGDLSVQAKITRVNGYDGGAVITILSVPEFTADPLIIAIGETTGTIIIHASATAPLGTSDLVIYASGYQVTIASTRTTIAVLAAGSYAIIVGQDANSNGGDLSAVPGTTIHAIVTITRQAFTAPITLRASLPAALGATVLFTPIVYANGVTTGLLDIGISGSAPAAFYNFHVIGSADGTADRSQAVGLGIDPGTYALSSAPASVTIPANGTGQSVVTATRDQYSTGLNIYTGPIALAVILPAGATGISATLSTSNLASGAPIVTQTSTLTVTVGPGANPGTYPITVHSTASGQFDKTTVVNVVVPGPAYTLSVVNAPLTVAANTTSVPDNVNITRSNFTGAISLSGVGQAGSGITAAFSAQPGTGNVGTFTVSVPPGLTAGTYNVTLTGTSSIANVTTSFAVIVPAATSNTTWAFCASTGTPLFFAVQDGSGAAWTAVTGSSGSYAFAINNPIGGIAYVVQNGATYEQHVFYGSKAELQTQGGALCPAGTGATKNVSASAINTGTAAWVDVSLGSTSRVWPTPTGVFSLSRILPGTLDLVAATVDGATPANAIKMLLRRGINPADGSTLTPLDFTGSESFLPLSAVLTLANSLGQQVGMFEQLHTTNNTLSDLFSPANSSSTTSRTLYGFPAANQAAGDIYYVNAQAYGSGQGAVAARMQGMMFAALLPKTLTFGPALGTVTNSKPAGVIMRLSLAVQPEYCKLWQADYDQISNFARSATVQMTAAYLGSASTANLDLPNFSSVTGWLTAYGLATGSPAAYNVTASNWSTAGITFVQFVDGATFSSANAPGTVTP